MDLSRIRAHLAHAGSGAAEPAEQRQDPQVQGDAGAEAQLKTLERDLERERARREEVEARQTELEAALSESTTEIESIRSQFEGRLAEADQEGESARAERDQAGADRDQALAELEEAKAELLEIRARLESELGSGGGKRAERRRAKERAETRIAELEGELQIERELREDLELALKLLEKHQADDGLMVQAADVEALEPLIVSNGANAPDLAPAEVAGEQLPDVETVEADPEPEPEIPAEPDAPDEVPAEVAAEEPAEAEPAEPDPEPQAERSWEAPADGWGVPMEAFPLTEPESKGEGNGSAGADRTARHGRSRRRLRRADR